MRYFFHYRDDNDVLSEDRVGSEHPDLASAESEARELAREFLEEAIAAGRHPSAPRSIEIVDDHGRDVLYLPFWASAVVFDENAAVMPSNLQH